MQMEFSDKMVSYHTFVNDLAERIVNKLQRMKKDPEIISQRKAYSMFGRGNVDRWKRKGWVHVRKRPGKIEYTTSELRMLQQKEQDYF